MDVDAYTIKLSRRKEQNRSAQRRTRKKLKNMKQNDSENYVKQRKKINAHQRKYYAKSKAVDNPIYKLRRYKKLFTTIDLCEIIGSCEFHKNNLDDMLWDYGRRCLEFHDKTMKHLEKLQELIELQNNNEIYHANGITKTIKLEWKNKSHIVHIPRIFFHNFYNCLN